MKVLFLIHGRSTASSRVRVLDLLPYLKRKEISIEVQAYGKSVKDKIRMLKSCKNADIVVIQKKLPTILDLILLRRNSKKLVYDFDDSIFFRHESSKDEIHRTNMRRLSNLLPKVDLVVAGNRILAEEARTYSENVEVIPSCIETGDSPPRNHQASSPFVVGWIGGNVNLEQANLLAPVMRKLSKEINLEVRIISGRPLEIRGVCCKFVQWTEENQYAELANLDAGLMPLPNSRHARGKCGYKALQYMSVGVPPVVSDVGVNGDIVLHGECGFVAKEIHDFEKYLLRLSQFPELRNSLGARAHARVKKHYNVRDAAERLYGLLREIR